MVLFVFVGIVLLGTHLPPLKFDQSKTAIPFLCFRVVTRGLYGDLVKRNVETNINTCYNVGLQNFKFEIVTDKPLNLDKSAVVREIVVPANYITRNKSLYKARALSYCNESNVNILSDDDWIVHLDEETILTDGSVIALANFSSNNDADIGQGIISYANEEIVNWVITLADSVRVSVDYGMMRFCFRVLGCPFMGFKGSFIIVKSLVEKEIGFDFGPKGSIAEDLMFALIAWSRGFKFNFVDGEMWEKSPFTLKDYFEQRKRWFVGHMFTLLSNKVPIKCKLGMIPTDLGWFLLFGNILNLPASIMFPLPLPLFLNITAGCLGGFVLFMFIFGSVKSFSLRRYGTFKKVVIIMATICVIPLAACMDATASLYGFITRDSGGFYIINKEKKCPRNSTEKSRVYSFNASGDLKVIHPS